MGGVGSGRKPNPVNWFGGNLGASQSGDEIKLQDYSGVRKHLDSHGQISEHDPVSVTDTTTINLTLAGQDIKADLIQSAVDHGSIGGLSDDDHTQYALVSGARAFTGNVTMNANLEVQDHFRTLSKTGLSTPATGTGVELFYDGTLNNGGLVAIDRGTTTYKKMNYLANDHNFVTTSDNPQVTINDTGLYVKDVIGVGTTPNASYAALLQGDVLIRPDATWSANDIATLYFGDDGHFIKGKYSARSLMESFYGWEIANTTQVCITIDSDSNVELGTFNTNSVQVESDGDVNFKGGGGLQFGEIYGYDNATASSLTSSFALVTSFDTDGQSNGSVTNSAANDRITVGKAGKYFVCISLTIYNDSGSGFDVILSLFKNGSTELTNIHAERTLASGTDKGSVSLSGIVSLAANDYVDLRAKTDGASADVIFQELNMSLMQLGG